MGSLRSRIPALLGGIGVLLIAIGIAALQARRRSERPFVDIPGRPGQYKTAATARAERRAYDGAPPVIPHPPFNISCIGCHTDQGIFVPDVGFAPATPHLETPGLGRTSNCRQCHVFRESADLWVASTFQGRAQDLRRGERMYPHAPPVVPHGIFMREACAACHSGPAVREELRCSHPERLRCVQCHVARITSELFPGSP